MTLLSSSDVGLLCTSRQSGGGLAIHQYATIGIHQYAAIGIHQYAAIPRRGPGRQRGWGHCGNIGRGTAATLVGALAPP